MKIYEKILALALCAATLCGVLTACGGNPDGGGSNTPTPDGSDAASAITLTVWGSQEDQQMLRDMCDAYAKDNSDKT